MNVETAGTILQIVIIPCLVYLHSLVKMYGDRLTILEENRRVQDDQLTVLNALVINMAEVNVKLDNLIKK